MLNAVKTAAADILGENFQYTVGKRTKVNEIIVMIAEWQSTRAIKVSFWFSPMDSKWLVSFTDKYKLEVSQGLIPEDVQYIKDYLSRAITKML